MGHKVAMKITKWLVLLVSLVGFTVGAANPAVSVYLEDWSRTYKPVNEICTGGLCGQSTSIHPKKNTSTSIYKQYDNGVITKWRTTYSDPGPVYHQTCTTILALTITNGAGSGTVYSMCSEGSSSTNAISSLELNEETTRGSLSTTTHHPGDYDNLNTLVDDCKISFKYVGGDGGYVYTYRLYFQVEEWVRNASGVLVSNGLVTYNHISVPSKTVYNGSSHGSGYAYINVDFNGGSSGKINITPSTPYPYYEISGFDVELISVVEK